MAAASDWPEAIHRTLGELSVRQVAYVPDAGHARLIELCQADPALRAVVLTTEEEGVALAAGAWLGGQRAVLLMQSSGVGNCVNMLALNQVGRFPLLALVTMRGEWGEQNPWQLPMGQSTPRRVEDCRRDRAAAGHAGERRRYGARRRRHGVRRPVPVAVLIGQRLIARSRSRAERDGRERQRTLSLCGARVSLRGSLATLAICSWSRGSAAPPGTSQPPATGL